MGGFLDGLIAIVVIVVLGGIVLLVGAVQGMAAFTRVNELTDRVAALKQELARLRAEIERLRTSERPGPAQPSSPPASAEPPRAPTIAPAVVRPAEPIPEPIAVQMMPAPSVPAPAAPQPAPPIVAPPELAATGIAPTSPLPSSPPPRVRTPVRPGAPRASAPADSAGAIEQLIGKRLITWVGVATVFLSLAFFVKYAYDQHWLGRVFGPRMRVGTVAGAGVAMIVAGLRLRARDMAALGFGLVGGGQAVLYLAVYAGATPSLGLIGTALISPQVAFILMTAVTAFGVGLAVRLDAMVIAILAVLGGFATPVLVSTGTNARDALFIYLMILDIGVLATALVRRWRALDALTFAGTAALFAGWFATHYHRYPALPEWSTLVWLCGFYAVFLALPFVNHWRARTPVTVERFGLALGNLAWFLGYSCAILADGDRHTLAWVCLALAIVYLAIGVAIQRRVPTDLRMKHAFITLATMLVTLSLFFHLRVDGLSVAWFAEAVALVELGYVFAYPPSRWLALAVAGLAFRRVLWDDWGEPYAGAQPILNPHFLMLATAPLAFALIAVVHRLNRARSLDADRVVAWVCGCGAGILALFAVDHELSGWLALGRSGASLDRAEGALVGWLWAAASGCYLVAAWIRDERRTAVVGLVCWVVAVGAALHLYADAWPDPRLFVNERFALVIATLASLALYAVAMWRRRTWFGPPGGLGALLISVLPIAVMASCFLETAWWCERFRPDAGRAITWSAGLIGWCGGVLTMLVGIRLRYTPLLTVGLVAVLAGAAAGLLCYAWIWPSALMFANRRCALGFAVVVSLAAMRRPVLALDRPFLRSVPTALVAIPAVLVWLLITLEPPTWLVTNLTEHGTAARAATFSITVAWLIYAGALLAAGFRWRWRWMRFTALALFGITALKLLIVDMADAQQLYRILSFLATGLTLIAASYAYHRAERRMAADAGTAAGTET